MTVVKEERPEGVGQGEHQVLPGAIGQAAILVSDPLIGGLFAAGRASSAVAGVAQVFGVVAVIVAARILLNAQNRGAAGEHFGHRFNFDIAQASGIEQVRPALVGGEQVFQWLRFVGRQHVQSPVKGAYASS